MIVLAYLSWLPVCLLVFKFASRRYAPWVSLIGGWVLLPPAIYPIPPSTGFPFWIIGGSLPSDILINKVWVVPLAVSLASFLFDAKRWRSTPLNLWDACLASFCIWPVIQEALVGQALPPGWVSSLYLIGAWALPWWLGRLYLKTTEDMQNFALVLTGAVLLLLPIAILEGASEARLHTLILGEHPFATDGLQRYIGYRPQAMFENGNQYGLWCAAATIAAFWLVQEKKLAASVCAILAVMTAASQSLGAVVLAVLGVIALHKADSLATMYRFRNWILLAAAAAAGLLVAGALPLREFVEQSGIGQALLDIIRSTGRGSFAWRVSQDLKAAPLLREHLFIGYGQWDWFSPLNTRPWGLPFLVIGQFGLLGFALLLLPFVRAVSRALREGAAGNAAARLTAVLIIISGLDALLNSFLLWPFIVLASPFAAVALGPLHRPSVRRSAGQT